MLPNKRIGPAAGQGRPGGDSDEAGSRLQLASVQGPQCSWCHGPLPPRRRRFCCDDHRRRGQKSERIIENSDYADGLNRQIRKMGARASGDLDALGWLAGAVGHARDALALAVDGCRAQGYSDGEIGTALGITRQAVGQRFGRKHDVYAAQQQPGVPA